MRVYVHIDGLHCGGGVNSIERQLSILGASKIDLDFRTFTLKVDYEESKFDLTKMMESIHALGYTPIYLGNESLEENLY